MSRADSRVSVRAVSRRRLIGQSAQLSSVLALAPGAHVAEVQGAGHVMGTHRMGSSPANSVTDSFGRCWDHPNLWLAGSGLFPTTGTGNPTLTIAALALRTAPQILADLAAAT